MPEGIRREAREEMKAAREETRRMFAEFLQYLLSGLTIGAIYALAGLGFSIIYNASHVINFAQGEFIMIGGMAAATLTASGVPLPLAILMGCGGAMIVGVLVAKFTVERARNASVATLIIITIGASIFIRGVTQIVLDKGTHRLPSFSGDDPIRVLGATVLPQSLWVVAGAVAIFVALWLFFTRTLMGRAVLATSNNRLAAQLVGINTRFVMTFSFALSAAIGALAGVLITPILPTSFEIGITLALKGFAAAMLGGMGNPKGALAGGLLLGLMEALTAGYISSHYKDAVAFFVILAVLFAFPRGLYGSNPVERV